MKIMIPWHATEERVHRELDHALFHSVAHDQITHVYAENQRYADARDVLLAWTDDTVEVADSDGRPMTEAWGASDDGDEWRIHVHSTEVER